MKAASYQIITVTGLFFLSITATLLISWGMNHVVFGSQDANRHYNKSRILLQKENTVKQKVTLKNAVRLLIPKLNK